MTVQNYRMTPEKQRVIMDITNKIELHSHQGIDSGQMPKSQPSIETYPINNFIQKALLRVFRLILSR